MGGKLLNGIKDIYVGSLACVKVKRGESECFRIESGVRQCCIMSSLIFNICMDVLMKEVKIGMWRRGVRFLKEIREWRLLGLLHVDVLVLCGKLEEDLMTILGRLVEVCRKRCLTVNTCKNKVILLKREEG